MEHPFHRWSRKKRGWKRRRWPWGSNKILRPRNRPIIVTARFDRVKHVVNVERGDPLADRNYS